MLTPLYAFARLPPPGPPAGSHKPRQRFSGLLLRSLDYHIELPSPRGDERPDDGRVHVRRWGDRHVEGQGPRARLWKGR